MDQAKDTCSVWPTSTGQISVQVGLMDQARDTCSVGPTSTDQISVQVGLMDQVRDTVHKYMDQISVQVRSKLG